MPPLWDLPQYPCKKARYGSKSKSRRFIDAALQNLSRRKGENPALEAYTHLARLTINRSDIPLNRNQASQLLGFLNEAKSLSLDHCKSDFLSMAPQRKTVFEYLAPLHQILSGGPHPTRISEEDRKWVVRYNLSERCRAASLIYLNKALLDQGMSAQKCARYLDDLIAKVSEQALEGHFPVESFSWLLLEDMCHFDLRSPDRAWFMGDIMDIFNILPYELQFPFSELLLSFLMLQTPVPETSLEKFEADILKHVETECRVEAVG